MRVHLGYPAAAAERELLSGVDRRDLVKTLQTITSADSLRQLQESVLEIHVSPALLDYVQALVAHTRRAPGLNAGLSPRAAIGLLRAARAWALIRDAVRSFLNTCKRSFLPWWNIAFASAAAMRLRRSGCSRPCRSPKPKGSIP